MSFFLQKAVTSWPGAVLPCFSLLPVWGQMPGRSSIYAVGWTRGPSILPACQYLWSRCAGPTWERPSSRVIPAMTVFPREQPNQGSLRLLGGKGNKAQLS